MSKYIHPKPKPSNIRYDKVLESGLQNSINTKRDFNIMAFFRTTA